MPSEVLAPFPGAFDLLGVGYCSGLVEALSKYVSNQGSRRGKVTTDPTVDVAQQTLPLFKGDAALQDLGAASLVEFALHNNKGLGMTCEPSGLHPIYRQCVMEEVVEVECSLVD